jgi:DNA-binding response OmpR family regulator
MPALILLVATDAKVLRRTETHLSEAGYLVAAVSSFQRAKSLLDSVRPDLLITDVGLDAYKGLHLAVRSRIDYPLLPVIITHPVPDPALESDAVRYGASFIVNPLENPEFMRCIKTAVEQHSRHRPAIRRWQRKQVAGVLEAALAAAPARIYDVSYGGLRLSLGGEQPIPDVFEVTVPGAGVTVTARSVWTYQSPTTNEFLCGAEVVDTGTPDMTGWRDLVDAT